MLSASQETHSYRVFLAELGRGENGNGALRWREALPENEKVYLFESPADAICAHARDRRFSNRTVILDRQGHPFT